MCRLKNSPIKAKYHNSLFGDHVDHCLVDVINHLNSNKDFATIASCCGHGKDTNIPYLTLLQPRSKIKEVKTFLENRLGWRDTLVSIFSDIPMGAHIQLGWKFMSNKVYVGYYSNAAHIGDLYLDSETWRESDIQMDEG